MDQVFSPPRSLTRTTAPPPASGVDASATGPEPAADPGEDPYSPGQRLHATADPLAESLGAMLGALLALLTLAVPLLGVLSDRNDEPSSSNVPERNVRLSASGGPLRR
jgi:hypothetical protein